MPEKKPPKSNEQKIKAEIKKIRPLFEKIDKERKSLVERQIAQLAFLQVTLDRIVDEVNCSDILEDFCQGSQMFKRENSALKSYNSTIKSYLCVTKQLCEMLPPGDSERAGAQLMAFLKAGAAGPGTAGPK
jgi:hypothetical protein